MEKQIGCILVYYHNTLKRVICIDSDSDVSLSELGINVDTPNQLLGYVHWKNDLFLRIETDCEIWHIEGGSNSLLSKGQEIQFGNAMRFSLGTTLMLKNGIYINLVKADSSVLFDLFIQTKSDNNAVAQQVESIVCPIPKDIQETSKTTESQETMQGQEQKIQEQKENDLEAIRNKRDRLSTEYCAWVQMNEGFITQIRAELNNTIERVNETRKWFLDLCVPARELAGIVRMADEFLQHSPDRIESIKNRFNGTQKLELFNQVIAPELRDTCETMLTIREELVFICAHLGVKEIRPEHGDKFDVSIHEANIQRQGPPHKISQLLLPGFITENGIVLKKARIQ